MNTLGKRSLFCTAVLLILALSIAGCGGDAQPAPSPTATVAGQAAAPTPVAATPISAAVASAPTPTSVAPSVIANPTPAIITATAALSPTNNVTVAAASNPGEPCPQEVDLDLAGYPDLQAKMGCPLELANFDPIAFNEFGPGPNFDRFMLWISNENKIYVLRPDTTWQTYDDTWKEGEPTYTCNPLKGEPKSPPLPRRGFNKIWCTVPKLQEIMGTTVLEERQCQHAVLQRFQQGRLLGCYEDATIRYIRLLDNGTWDTLLTR